MTEKLWSKDVTLRFGGTVALAEVVAVEFPQAAATIAMAPRHAIRGIDLSPRNLCSPPDGVVLLGPSFWGVGHAIRKQEAGFREKF
jgi:hypothetical protein